MVDPRSALAIQKMFPGSYGYRVAQPQNPPKPQGKPKKRFRVWGFDGIDGAKVEFLGGTTELTPPDTVLSDDRYPGGSSGLYNYLLAISTETAPKPYVDQFDRGFTTQIDRWTIPNWFLNTGDGALYLPALSWDFQHVCANATNVVVVADVYDNTDPDPNTGGNDKHYIGVAVFDVGGTLLNQYLVYTTDAGSGDEGALGGNAGSCTDGEFVYFWHFKPDTFGEVAKVELSTGTFTALPITEDGVIAASPDSGSSWVAMGGLVVVPGGDLILVGEDIARVKQDGTPVWFAANPDPGSVGKYEGLSLSGRNSVWASGLSASYVGASPIAHEFSYSGLYTGASAFVEPVSHTWLANQ